ncbi:MAG: hypothetical protein JRI89_12265 [Deltaproteobacteria bacterium]|nr:hypothetical protein [Deltaproteobacteria bacterium]
MEVMPILFFSLPGLGGNGARVYQCISCRHMITHSDKLLFIMGSNRHMRINPQGIECDFHTFSVCPGAIPLGEPTLAHTWFDGYTWQLALCRFCGQHLGWYYQSLSESQSPRDFWGLLINALYMR